MSSQTPETFRKHSLIDSEVIYQFSLTNIGMIGSRSEWWRNWWNG